jgi:hypothetical protein
MDTLASRRVLSGANGNTSVLFYFQYYCVEKILLYLTTSGSYREIKHHLWAVGFLALYWYVPGLYPLVGIFMGFFPAHTWIVAMYSSPRNILQNYFKMSSQNFEKRLLASSCLSVCLHGTTQLSQEGLSWNLIFVDFSKILRENSIFIRIWQE